MFSQFCDAEGANRSKLIDFYVNNTPNIPYNVKAKCMRNVRVLQNHCKCVQ